MLQLVVVECSRFKAFNVPWDVVLGKDKVGRVGLQVGVNTSGVEWFWCCSEGGRMDVNREWV